MCKKLSNETQMEKESKKSIGEKLGTFTGFIKNAKFLVLTTITLVPLGQP